MNNWAKNVENGIQFGNSCVFKRGGERL